jgi:alpha-tubulin suppressor-like RCC1 family protein
VSLAPGALPGGVTAIIRDLRNGFARTAPLEDGGFDPVAVPGAAGDTLEITVTDSTGAAAIANVRVPERRPPVIVRTDPPRGKTDVGINARILVVFSEPVSGATITPATIQLVGPSGTVAGSVALRPGSPLVAELRTDALLAPETTYLLKVTTRVTDLSGDSIERAVEVQFVTGPQLLTAFTSVSAGGSETCASGNDGQVYCWGYLPKTSSDDGWSGVHTTPVPLQVPDLVTVSAGSSWTCGLTRSGSVRCWGDMADSALVAGSSLTWTGSEHSVFDPSGGTLRFSTLSTGDFHACGVEASGVAYCWGLNFWGQLGDTAGFVQERWTASILNPVVAAGGTLFRSVSAGSYHTCGLTASGAAWCWGDNRVGQLGRTGVVSDPQAAPVDGGLVFASLAAGAYHTCGITTSGAAYCWGTSPHPVQGNLQFVALTAGQLHTCGITASGAAYCWGSNGSGELGDGTTVNRTSPQPVQGDLPFVAISAGDDHTCGLLTWGDVYCWGYNGSGQLGDGSLTSRRSPVRVLRP